MLVLHHLLGLEAIYSSLGVATIEANSRDVRDHFAARFARHQCPLVMPQHDEGTYAQKE